MIETTRFPKFATNVTTFPFLQNIFPDKEQLKEMLPDVDLKLRINLVFRLARLELEAYHISLEYLIKYKKLLMKPFIVIQKNLLLVFSTPEPQPKAELFDENGSNLLVRVLLRNNA